MTKAFLLYFLLLSSVAFTQAKKPYLISFVDTSSGNKLYGYKTLKGKIVIPAKYYRAYSGKLCNYAIVVKKECYKWVAINNKDSLLWEAFIFDNLPDVSRNGLFRVIVDGKVGFANEQGKIVIKPLFDGANSFSEGFAAVNIGGRLATRGEHSFIEGGHWGYIDKKGKYVLKPQFHDAGDFENGSAPVVTKDGTEVKINKKGKVIKH
jgi:hypothetical protein